MSEARRPVLFVTVPNVPLFMKKKKSALGLSLGSVFAAGAIRHAGLPVVFYDFNYSLNRMRDDADTPRDTILRLTDPEIFLGNYSSRADARIEDWIERLVAEIPRENYSAICLSLDRREYYAFSNKASFCFSLLLARKLRSLFNVPVLLGGKLVLRTLGQKFINGILDRLDPNPIERVVLNRTFLSLGQALRAHQDGMEIKSEAFGEILKFEDPYTQLSDFAPLYDLGNKSDLLVERSEYLPDEIVKRLESRHPGLREIEPFSIVPYRFSYGCPFTCAFCNSGLGKNYFRVSAENLVERLHGLQRQGVENFLFYNDNINLNWQFLVHVRDLMKEAGVKIRFSDSANLQNANDDYFGLLSEIGCVRLWYGAESVSERLLKIINKNLNLPKIERGLAAADRHQIWNCGNFIYNFPHEREDEFDALIDFITHSPYVNGYETNEFRLFPDTAYGQMPDKYGIAPLHSSDNKLVSAYDEIGGLSWREKQALGKKKQKRIATIERPIFSYMANNEYLTFGLRRAGLTKPQMVEVLQEYTRYLRESEALDRYSDEMLHTLPSHRFERVDANAIFGQDAPPATIAAIREEQI